MSKSYRSYRRYYRLARFFIGIFYRIAVTGLENIPDGAVLICSNHSSNVDPFLAAFTFGIKRHLHIIAKAEVFRIPIIRSILKKLGMISVDRGTLDFSTVKASLGYLKNGEKVLIFPEGTRVADDAASAKIGAIKLAERAGVPILPVFIPRKKPLFRKVTINIGAPYKIDKPSGKLSQEQYIALTDELMERIRAQGPGVSEK